jgi:hypothetical protein
MGIMKCKVVSLPYGISTISTKGFMGYMENFIYGLIKIRLFYGSIWLKIRISCQF